MQLIDTVVIVGAINETDRFHKKSLDHLAKLESAEDIFVPSPTLIEVMLELKSSGFSNQELTAVFEDLAAVIPKDRILSQSVTSMALAIGYYRTGPSFFDSLIYAMAKELDATIITTDKEIASRVRVTW